MMNKAHLTLRPQRILTLLLLSALVICIFIADTITDFEIAFAVFYTAIILVSIRWLSKHGVVILAVICTFLTILSLLLTSTGSYEMGVMNGAISISAIGTTTYLALKIVAAEAAVHESRAQLARIARLLSLGELTASIAHEVNQPLSAIATSVGACQRWLEAGPPNMERARQSLDRISREATRASEVIARVRRLAQGKAPQRESLNLNKTINEAVALARSEMERQNVALKTRLDGALPPVLADPIQLQQVIANLLLNAIEAMYLVPREQRRLEISSRVDDGMVSVEIADTGLGLALENPDHLFDAFWTTKKDGIGIGLSISRSIIETHGGRIWATPNTTAGATFQFTLPVSRE